MNHTLTHIIIAVAAGYGFWGIVKLKPWQLGVEHHSFWGTAIANGFLIATLIISLATI